MSIDRKLRMKAANLLLDECSDFHAIQKCIDEIKLVECDDVPEIFLVLELRYVDGAQRVAQVDLAALRTMSNVTDVRPVNGHWLKREKFIREQIEYTEELKRNRSPLWDDENRYLDAVTAN